MKSIELSGGQIALIDDCDFDAISRYRWFSISGRHTSYAATSIRGLGKRGGTIIRMHRLIMGVCWQHRVGVDHKDGNGLNNQRHNLRICDTSTNLHGVMRGPRGTSQYRGVSWSKSAKRWEVRLSVRGKRIVIGYYESETEAASAYDAAKLHLIGPDCQLSGLPE